MVKTVIFQDHGNQAVHLPKEVAFPDDVNRIEVVALGNARLVTPVGGSWDSFFDAPSVSEDYLP